MRDLLSDAVFVKFKIGGFQPVDDPACLPFERLSIDHDQIGAQPDALCKSNFAFRRVLRGLRVATGLSHGDTETQRHKHEKAERKNGDATLLSRCRAVSPSLWLCDSVANVRNQGLR